MRLYLEFTEGPIEGKKFSLTTTTSLGRGEANIQINDPKLSVIHAFFKYSERKGWKVIDNKSRNGIWVNGYKEIEYVISDGSVLQVGSNKIVCRIVDSGKLKLSGVFKAWLDSMVQDLKNGKNPKVAVKPEMRLKVIQGAQFGETWDIFYGPREAGREHSDICLFEERAPEKAFKIEMKGHYAYFATEHENIVKINNLSLKSKQFAPGDVISIGESLLLVEFDEGHGFGS